MAARELFITFPTPYTIPLCLHLMQMVCRCRCLLQSVQDASPRKTINHCSPWCQIMDTSVTKGAREEKEEKKMSLTVRRTVEKHKSTPTAIDRILIRKTVMAGPCRDNLPTILSTRHIPPHWGQIERHAGCERTDKLLEDNDHDYLRGGISLFAVWQRLFRVDWRFWQERIYKARKMRTLKSEKMKNAFHPRRVSCLHSSRGVPFQQLS